MIESCFGNHLNVQHATDYMGTYLMYLWAINVIVIIDWKNGQMGLAQNQTTGGKPRVFVFHLPRCLSPKEKTNAQKRRRKKKHQRKGQKETAGRSPKNVLVPSKSPASGSPSSASPLGAAGPSPRGTSSDRSGNEEPGWWR